MPVPACHRPPPRHRAPVVPACQRPPPRHLAQSLGSFTGGSLIAAGPNPAMALAGAGFAAVAAALSVIAGGARGVDRRFAGPRRF